jgi:hypothetical protein
VAEVIGLSSSKVKVTYSFSQKMNWATLWAIFSKTHPVTLFPELRMQ